MWKGGIFLLENIRLKEKIMESLASVLPLTAIVFILSITLLPLSSGALVLFLFGAVMLIIGMGFFTMGADMSMMPMGEGIGMEMSRTKNIGGPLLVCFILGMLITIAEPDLQVLAEQVPAIPNKILILSVAAGVGLFLMIAQIRIFFHIPLAKMLWVFYPLVFLLAFLAPDSFIPVSFDSGGVTTGPVTVPARFWRCCCWGFFMNLIRRYTARQRCLRWKQRGMWRCCLRMRFPNISRRLRWH